MLAHSCTAVCLSLLGTWSGGRGEGWDPNSSTALQVVLPHVHALLFSPIIHGSATSAWHACLRQDNLGMDCVALHCIMDSSGYRSCNEGGFVCMHAEACLRICTFYAFR